MRQTADAHDVDERAEDQQEDAAGGDSTRDETPQQRADRNFNELLQELRVLQTGVQILAGFLLTVPFQQRFEHVDALGRGAYCVSLCCALLAVAVFVAPVASHRLLFRRRLKREIVELGDRFAKAGLVLLAGAVVAAVLLVLDVVAGMTAAVAAACGFGVVFLAAWLVLPLLVRHRHQHR